jgi:hypothetical protein
LNTKFFRLFVFIAILLNFNDAYAVLQCVQSTGSDGVAGYFVQDGATIMNGKNGTEMKRCGMSRRDQGSDTFKTTSAPPSAAAPASASPLPVTLADPSSPNTMFQPNFSFTVPQVLNGVRAELTLYSGSSADSLVAGAPVTVTPGTTFTSPGLTANNYYAVDIKYFNVSGTAGSSSRVVAPFKYNPCNGAPICNAKMTFTNTVSSSTWFHKVNQRANASAADPATPTTATVSFVAVHTGTDYDVCVGISNASTIFAKTRVTTTGPLTMTGTFTGNVLGYLGCQGAGCTVRLIKDASCGSASVGTKDTKVGAAWNSLPQTYLGTILP